MASTMGTGSSRPKVRKNSNNSNILPTMVAIGSFSKHTEDVNTRRRRLMEFTRDMRRRNSNADGVTGPTAPAQFLGFDFTEIEDDEDEIKNDSEERETVEEEESELENYICTLCQEAVQELNEREAFPCRVCSRFYHKPCLISSQKCHKSGLRCLEFARTHIGWSCYRCSDLIRLLTDEEVDKLTEKFEHCDLNNDGSITAEEFLSYKSRVTEEMEGHHVTDDEKLYLKSRFRLMDLDGDNCLDWWEFVVQESKEQLARRKPEDLVKLLTKKEISKVRESFNTLDKSGSGKVDLTVINKTGASLYKSINAESVVCDSMTNAPSFIMGRITDWKTTNSGKVTWKEFLSGQAWSIICSRPNWSYPDGSSPRGK